MKYNSCQFVWYLCRSEKTTVKNENIGGCKYISQAYKHKLWRGSQKIVTDNQAGITAGTK